MTNSTIDSIERDFPESRIEELYKEGRARIDPDLAAFLERHTSCEDLLRARWDDIRQLIYHVDGRIKYWEERRTQYLTFAAGILVAALAALISITKTVLEAEDVAKTFVVFLPILAPSAALLVSSIRLIAIWNRQNNPSYPFTKGYRTWRWHYRHAEGQPLDTDTSSYTAESFSEQVRRFVENLYLFKKKMLDADLKELLDQDISQLYLLLSNEKFKIKFVSELRDSLVWALTSAFWMMIISLIGVLVYFAVQYGVFAKLRLVLGQLGQLPSGPTPAPGTPTTSTGTPVP